MMYDASRKEAGPNLLHPRNIDVLPMDPQFLVSRPIKSTNPSQLKFYADLQSKDKSNSLSPLFR